MAHYQFTTTWRLPAALSDAWTVLTDAEGWPRWWPRVQAVERLAEGTPDGEGRVFRFRFATRLPYTLTFDARVMEVTEPVRLVVAAEGELAGTWTCDLSQDGPDAVISHVWHVRTTRPWMNLLAPIAGPLFAWNHTALMREGGEGFGRQLGTSARVEGGGQSRLVVSVLVKLVLLSAAVLVVRRLTANARRSVKRRSG